MSETVYNILHGKLDYHSIMEQLQDIEYYGVYDEDKSEYFWHYADLINELRLVSSDLYNDISEAVYNLNYHMPILKTTFFIEDYDIQNGIAWFNVCASLLHDIDMMRLLMNEDVFEYEEELNDQISTLIAQRERLYKHNPSNDEKRRQLWEQLDKLNHQIRELSNFVENNKEQRLKALMKLTKKQLIECYTLTSNNIFRFLQLSEAFNVVKACIDELEDNNSFMKRAGEFTAPKAVDVF